MFVAFGVGIVVSAVFSSLRIDPDAPTLELSGSARYAGGTPVFFGDVHVRLIPGSVAGEASPAIVEVVDDVSYQRGGSKWISGLDRRRWFNGKVLQLNQNDESVIPAATHSGPEEETYWARAGLLFHCDLGYSSRQRLREWMLRILGYPQRNELCPGCDTSHAHAYVLGDFVMFRMAPAKD